MFRPRSSTFQPANPARPTGGGGGFWDNSYGGPLSQGVRGPEKGQGTKPWAAGQYDSHPGGSYPGTGTPSGATAGARLQNESNRRTSGFLESNASTRGEWGSNAATTQRAWNTGGAVQNANSEGATLRRRGPSLAENTRNVTGGMVRSGQATRSAWGRNSGVTSRAFATRGRVVNPNTAGVRIRPTVGMAESSRNLSQGMVRSSLAASQGMRQSSANASAEMGRNNATTREAMNTGSAVRNPNSESATLSKRGPSLAENTANVTRAMQESSQAASEGMQRNSSNAGEWLVRGSRINQQTGEVRDAPWRQRSQAQPGQPHMDEAPNPGEQQQPAAGNWNDAKPGATGADFSNARAAAGRQPRADDAKPTRHAFNDVQASAGSNANATSASQRLQATGSSLSRAASDLAMSY